ncbi:MAG: hemolysin III family protein [Acidobacteriota bacterium]|nr:hemolysin III family protein [Acidobacteriota bacterium]
MVRTKLNELTVEEFANTITHGFGLLLSFAGFVILLALALSSGGDFRYVLSSVIYGSSLIVLYAASTCYHCATSPKLKKRLQILDHCCIYLLIAGTYTPFTLVALRGSLGETLFIAIWSLAALGILSKIFFGRRFPVVSVLSYLVMGWLGIVGIEPLYAALGLMPVALMFAGGGAYTVGVVFFAWKSIRHHHAIWHVFVLTGSVLHFLAVALYVAPYAAKV